MFTRSIRWRLLLWFAFLLAGILGGFGITAYQLHRQNLLGQVDDELERRVAAIRWELRPRPPGSPPGRHSPGEFGPGGPGGPSPFDRPPPGRGPGPRQPQGTDRADGPEPPDGHDPRDFRDSRTLASARAALARFEDADPLGLYFAVWSRGGTLVARSTNAPPDLPRPTAPSAGTRIHARVRPPFREAYQFSAIGECVVVGRSVSGDMASLRAFAGWLVAAGAAVLAIGLGGAWALASQALRPIETIGATASRISDGHLCERIDIAETESELGRLAGVLNSTFARLEAAFAQQKNFTADASHELRTPLTLIISEAQTILARERSATEYRQTVVNCLEVAQQMRRLTESLLALARFDAGQEALEHAPADLADCTRVCLDFVRPLAVERGLSLEASLEPAPVLGDADRLSQVITNLLTNAVHHNRPHGSVRVVTRREGPEAMVEVSDTGPGIPPEDLPRVGERFFRADKARGRAEGRTGLGLAIAKAIVAAHGGNLVVRSTPGVGTTMGVRLPALPGSPAPTPAPSRPAPTGSA